MVKLAQPVIRITTPHREFKDHEGSILAVTVFPDGRRMVSGSLDRTVRLWDLQDGVVLKKMEGHRGGVWAVAVSRDSGQLIASGDENGELIAWHGDTGESLTQAIKVHSKPILSLDFSPDGALLATGSWYRTTKLWSTKTWQVQGNPISCGADVGCVRFSPSGELLAIATRHSDIQIWNPRTSECIAKLRGAMSGNVSVAWTPDGKRLLSAGTRLYPNILEWDTSTWQNVGDPWSGHSDQIAALAVNSAGTLVASASHDSHVRLWCLSDRRAIAVFKASDAMCSVVFSIDGQYILCGGVHENITEWVVPDDALLEDTPRERASDEPLLQDVSEEQATNEARRDSHAKVLSINTAVRGACLTRDLHMAEILLTRQINADGNNYNSYANRSFVMARQREWDHALKDAVRSISIQPSLSGYISKGIALCGKMHFGEMVEAFDIAFMFTDGDSNAIHVLLLIKAIAIFNASKYKEAIIRIQELAAACPNADTLACRVVEAYLHVQLGISALDDARHKEAADYFAAAISVLSSERTIHSKYEIFVVLFGWDLQSLWQSANQKRCHALLMAGRLSEAHEAYRYMMDMSDEVTKASCLDWSNVFKQELSALYGANGVCDLAMSGDAALAASAYGRAIELYSAAIDLDSATDTIFANRCKAKLESKLWEEALIDATKVTKLNPSSYLGYQLKHAALHGGQRYAEAIEAFSVMMSKLCDIHNAETQQLRQQYVSPSEAKDAIQEVIHAQLDNTPHRLLNTSTGHLCDRQAQINAFKMSVEYKELLSSTIKHADFRMERIEKAVEKYFRCAMLSHRWEENEPLLHDIHGKVVYDLNPVGGIAKLQSFCSTARDAGFRWAWVDTCCIDQTNNVEIQESVNSMFVWYRHAALTIVYLSDVSPSSESGALAKSVWNKRGWTVQEFLAPKVVLFYQKDWTLYLNDCSSNHKDSAAIMQEMGDTTGIDSQALVAFHPGMSGAREKLQWASTRVTTLQEDIAYSLFGIFGIHLPVIYGEKKQNALGRLLQEIVAQSGDISCLDWIGKSSAFNSSLPASISSYGAPASALLSQLSEDDMQKLVSSLQRADAVEWASQLYTKLDHLSAPRFAHRRLHLPCLIFSVTEVTQRPGHEQDTYFTYEIKADGLHDMLITTEDILIPSSRVMHIRQKLLFVRPWDRILLELHEPAQFTDDAQSIMTEDYQTPPSSPVCDPSDMVGRENAPFDSESDSRALRLIVLLGQRFGGFLLAQQLSGEYKRIAADHEIIAQVKNIASVHDMMDVRTLEIL